MSYSNPKAVLICCEFSGIVREAFKKLGYDAWSCDLLDTEIPGQHIKGDCLSLLKEPWSLVIAHPPCTYLTNAGVRHLYDSTVSRLGNRAAIFGKERWKKMEEACEFFNEFKKANSPRICIENPVPHKYSRALIGKYTQIIQPFEHGHGETKKTCLWLIGLPKLVPSNIVEGRYPRCHLEGPSKDRWKNRSRTYSGIAEALANQYGGLL